MRRTFTLITALLITFSLMGQTAKRNLGHKTKKGHRIIKQSNMLKSNMEVKYRLDSLVYEEYDDGTSQWNNSDKSEFEYDNFGNMIRFVDYFWDETEDVYIPKAKDIYSYNINGKEDTITYYGWDSSSEIWEVDYEDVYSYDANDICTLITTHGYEEFGTEWILYGKLELTYNSNIILYANNTTACKVFKKE